MVGRFHGRLRTCRLHGGGGVQRCFRRIIAVIPNGARKVTLQILFGDESDCGVNNFFRLPGGRWRVRIIGALAFWSLRCGRLFVRSSSRARSTLVLHRFAGFAKRACTLVTVTAAEEVASISFSATDLLDKTKRSIRKNGGFGTENRNSEIDNLRLQETLSQKVKRFSLFIAHNMDRAWLTASVWSRLGSKMASTRRKEDSFCIFLNTFRQSGS